jgi:hypothetical protein
MKSQVLMLLTEFVAKHGNAWVAILSFLREPQAEMRSAVVFEDMVDVCDFGILTAQVPVLTTRQDIKQSIAYDLSAEQLQHLEDTLRSLFEDLEY